MITGSTYLERMWCVMEIFVLIAAVNDMSRLECIPLRPSRTEAKTAADNVMDMFRVFTVGHCKCSSHDVRDKLLCIIEAGCGTLENFDMLVRAMEISFTREDPSPGASLSTLRTNTKSSPENVQKAELVVSPEAPNAEVEDGEPLYIMI